MRDKTKEEIIREIFADEIENAIDAMGEYFITLTEKAMEEWVRQSSPSPKDQPEGEMPKMSDELAAQSDVAALEYSKNNAGDSQYLTGADICEAHEAGQSWMYHKMQEEINQRDYERHAAKEMQKFQQKQIQEYRKALDDWRKFDPQIHSLIGFAQETKELLSKYPQGKEGGK